MVQARVAYTAAASIVTVRLRRNEGNSARESCGDACPLSRSNLAELKPASPSPGGQGTETQKGAAFITLTSPVQEVRRVRPVERKPNPSGVVMRAHFFIPTHQFIPEASPGRPKVLE